MKNNVLQRWIRVLSLTACLVTLSGCGGGGTAPRYTLSGSIKGLDSGETVTLADAAGASVTVPADGAFSFPTSIATGSSYTVSISTQPIGQTCNVTGGSGTIGSTNVANVAVACTNNLYTIGGTVTGTNGVS